MKYYTESQLEQMAREIESLPHWTAMKKINSLKSPEFRVDWIIGNPRRLIIRKIEHSPSTCFRYGHQQLITEIDDAQATIDIKCTHCEYNESMDTERFAEFIALERAIRLESSDEHNAIRRWDAERSLWIDRLLSSAEVGTDTYYTDQQLSQIAQRLNQLEPDAKQQTISTLARKGFIVNWNNDDLSLEHKPTTCNQFGHQRLTVLRMDKEAGTVEIECQHCGYKMRFEEIDEFVKFQQDQKERQIGWRREIKSGRRRVCKCER